MLHGSFNDIPGFAAQLLGDARAQQPESTTDGRDAESPPMPMFQVTPADEDMRQRTAPQSGRLTASNAQPPEESVSNRPPTTFPGAAVKGSKAHGHSASGETEAGPKSMAAQLFGSAHEADATLKIESPGAYLRPSTALAARLLGDDPAGASSTEARTGRAEWLGVESSDGRPSTKRSSREFLPGNVRDDGAESNAGVQFQEDPTNRAEYGRSGSNMSLSADNGDGRPGTKRSDRQARTPRFNNKIAPEGLTRGQVENVKQLQAQHLTQGLVFDDSASWRPGTTHVLITSADNDGFSSGTGGKDLLQAAFARTSTAANSALRPGTALPGSVMGSIASHLLLGGDGLLRPGSQRPGASRVGKRPATFRPGSRAVTQSRMSSRLLPNPEDALTKDAVEEIKELHTQQLMHGIDMDPLAWPGLRFGRNPFCKRDLLFHPFSGTMAYTAALHTISILLEFVDVVLRGYGQVTFINNPLAGALIMIASFINNAYYGVFGLLGIVSSTLTAYLFDFPRGAITSGIYGYNGYLVGTAVVLFQADYGGDWNFLEACCGCAADTCG